MFGNSLTLFSFASVAAAGLASGAAISARQTPATCETFSFASLAVRPKGSSGTSQATWAGVIPGVTHDGINGKQASILVTKDDNGNALKPQIWEFARCTSLDNHPLPPDYTPPTSGRPETYFGIVRPQNATQHCLAVESTSDADPGDRNSVLDSSCTQIPEQYRTWFFHSIAASQATQYLEFANQDMTIVISDTKHAELQFLTNGAKAGQTELEMVLIDSRL
jgi:hypothetical protein